MWSKIAVCCECGKGAYCTMGSYIDDKGEEYIGFVCKDCIEEQENRKEETMSSDHVTDISKKVELMKWTERIKYEAVGGEPCRRQFEIHVERYDEFILKVNVADEMIYIGEYLTLEDAREAAELMLEVLKKCQT